ncbi:MAG: hypothetical protein KGH57_03430 [Candidatus Micrarchaeota archaeon]|nr:hypothetical protein [Candidatus Micrarchaeota archaeon]
MLLAILFLLLSIAVGFGIVERLGFFDTLLENFALGVPAGIVISSFIVLGLYVLQRGFTDATFFISLVIMAAVIVLLYWKRLSTGRFAPGRVRITPMPKGIEYTMLLVYGIIAFVLITSMYMYNGSLYCVGPAICSDLLYHMGIGNSVIYGGFPPKFPFTIDTLNVFPFINDFYSALLMRYGFGLVAAALLPYLLLFLSAVVITTELAYLVLKNKFATLAAMLVFWFGSDFIMAFIVYPLNAALPFIPSELFPLSSITRDYGVTASGIGALFASTTLIISGWTSILYQNLLPQRGFVLALPLGVMLIYFAYQFLFKKRRFTRPQLAFIGVIVGLMPLTHPITLVVLAFVGAYVLLKLLLDSKRRSELRTLALYVAVPAAVLIIPQIAYMASQPPVPGRYHFVYQYFYPTTGNLVSNILSNMVSVPSFWIDLLGVPLFLAVAGYVFARKEFRSFVLPFLAIWIFVTIFSFELDGSDANKLFMYVFLMLCILGGYVFAKLYSMKLAWKFLAVLLILANIANFPAVYGRWVVVNPLQWLSSSELNASTFVMGNTSINSVFAVSDYSTLQQTIPSLGARQTLLSMYPYVQIDEYTHPLNQLILDNEQIFSTGDCSLIRSLNISYVYLLSNSTNDTVPFTNSNFTLVFSQPDPLRGAVINIYKVRC